MTIAEELHRMGIPESKCEHLADKIFDAVIVSGTPDALNRILTGLRILIQNEDQKRLANYSAGLLKK